MFELIARDFRRTEVVRNSYTAIAPAGTPIEAVTEPEYWRHVAHALRKNDMIEIIAEDGSFDVTLRVTEVAKLYVKTRMMLVWEADATAGMTTPTDLAAIDQVDTANGVTVSWGGRYHRWRMVDDKSGEVIEKDFADRSSALAARDAYLLARAA